MLLERDLELALLQEKLQSTANGLGHCVFIEGEPGIGKTSLVEAFTAINRHNYTIFTGVCDQLTTPRPLAAVYDLLTQADSGFPFDQLVDDDALLFSTCMQVIRRHQGRLIIILEDVHWADPATHDFIKYFVRRVSRISCLFIVTYCHAQVQNPYTASELLNQFASEHFSRIHLRPLSKPAVQSMVEGFVSQRKDIYKLSGGNPRYVQEIASTPGNAIPHTIVQSILANFYNETEAIQRLWQTISIVTNGVCTNVLLQMFPYYHELIEVSLQRNIIIKEDEVIRFKHEVYRKAIESSIDVTSRQLLCTTMLRILLSRPLNDWKPELAVQLAITLNRVDLVEGYAREAAANAASRGDHNKSACLYQTAIKYCPAGSTGDEVSLYEAHAFECFLTNQLDKASGSITKAIKLLNDLELPETRCILLRCASIICWFNGKGREALSFAKELVKGEGRGLSSLTRLRCNSYLRRFSKLVISADHTQLLTETSPGQNIHDHTTGNEFASTELQLINSYSEQTTPLDSAPIVAAHACVYNALLCFQKGDFTTSSQIVSELLSQDRLCTLHRITCLTIHAITSIRRGEFEALELLQTAKLLALEALDLQRTVFCYVSLLEYEWLTGRSIVPTKELEEVSLMVYKAGDHTVSIEYNFWLEKAQRAAAKVNINTFQHFSPIPYLHALILFEGSRENKIRAIGILSQLGADATYAKLKSEMRRSGIKSIPRGMRSVTRSNPAFLTARQLDVLKLMREGLQNKEIACRLFISAKTVDHHISSILFKLDVNSRTKAVREAVRLQIIS